MAAAWVAAHLPEPPLVAAADAAGELWYRTAPSKRLQARANLQRVCEGLAASGRGPARARRAATDPQAPEQWYSFKPIWPDTPEEAAVLEARATAMLAEAA